MRSLSLCCIAMIAAAVSAGATEIYVSADGNDANPGTPAQPLATVQAAQTNVRALIAAGLSEPVDVIIRGGTYYLDSPLELRPEDSGSAAFPITWRAASTSESCRAGTDGSFMEI